MKVKATTPEVSVQITLGEAEAVWLHALLGKMIPDPAYEHGKFFADLYRELDVTLSGKKVTIPPPSDVVTITSGKLKSTKYHL